MVVEVNVKKKLVKLPAGKIGNILTGYGKFCVLGKGATDQIYNLFLESYYMFLRLSHQHKLF